MTDIEIKKGIYFYLKLGNSIHNHFIIEVSSNKNKGRIMLIDKHELVTYSYSFNKEGVDTLIEFLRLLRS